MVGHIMLGVPVLRASFSPHSCNPHYLSSLEVTGWCEVNHSKFQCTVGATQPIGIFLPLPSHESMQLCGFYVLPLSYKFIHL